MSSTVHLVTKEDRRTWQALTRCAPSPDDRAALAYVALDGDRAYATDGYLVGALDATVDLPIIEVDDDVRGPGTTFRQAERILLPAVLLRDAIGLAKGKTQTRIRLEETAALVVLGEDPLPGMGDPPTVRIPYAEDAGFPPAETLRRHLDGDPLDDVEAIDRHHAGEVVTKLGLDADRLAKLAALEYRLADQISGQVTIRPRPGATGYATILEVRAVSNGARLGVMTRLHLEEIEERRTTASGGISSMTVTHRGDSVTIDADVVERLNAQEREARDDA